MASVGLRAQDAEEHEHEHTVPLLANAAQEEHSADSSTLQPGQPDLGLPASMAPQQLTHQVSQRRRRSELDIQASVATYPLVTGVPVGGPEGLQFLPDLPNTIQLWRSQHTLMLAWCASSVVLLLLFAPFFITTGLFLGAEVACILGIMASGVHLCKRAAADGLELGGQVKLAATCGAAAFFLDCLTAFMDLLVVWSVDCEGDEACNSVMNYAVLFGLCLSWHAYLSMAISTRARSLMPLLNPVSSGVVQL